MGLLRSPFARQTLFRERFKLMTQNFTKAEKYLGETKNADGVVSRWFFSRDGGRRHVLKSDGAIHPTCAMVRIDERNFTVDNVAHVALSTFWNLAGIEEIQDELRAYLAAPR
jgi:hypothetical protein